MDRDSVTDLLLVGAPMYMSDEKREEGRVYLFSVTKVKKRGNMSVGWVHVGICSFLNGMSQLAQLAAPFNVRA